MRAILVPVDGSPLAESALPTAFAIARSHPGARVEAVVVLAVPPNPILISGAPVPDRRLEHDLRAETEKYSESLQSRLGSMANGVPVSLVTLEGDVIDQIVNRARDGGCDLIVMTTHGRSGVSRLWLGSVADGVLRAATVPVLLLREESAAPVADHALFSTVLIPLDEGKESEEILADVIAVAGTKAMYHLIHVVVPLRWLPPPSAFAVVSAGEALHENPADLVSHMRDAAVQHLEEVASRLRGQGIDASTHTPVHQHAAEAIIAYAEETGAGLIAMTSHGRDTAGRVLLGSVSDKVIRGATVPVLVRVPSHD